MERLKARPGVVRGLVSLALFSIFIAVMGRHFCDRLIDRMEQQVMEQQPAVLAASAELNSAFPQWLSLGMAVEILGEEDGELRRHRSWRPLAAHSLSPTSIRLRWLIFDRQGHSDGSGGS
jgi:hypothetical protein